MNTAPGAHEIPWIRAWLRGNYGEYRRMTSRWRGPDADKLEAWNSYLSFLPRNKKKRVTFVSAFGPSKEDAVLVLEKTLRGVLGEGGCDAE